MQQDIQFIIEIDKLKSVLRKTKIMTGERLENSAEHSWHLAIMALTLAKYSPIPLNVPHVVEMLLIHDIVEIDAGDVFIYDEVGYETKAEKERLAADRIFGLLGEEGKRFRNLWDEFEAQETPESRFAASIDRIQPILSNLQTDGFSWKEHGVGLDQVLSRNQFTSETIPEIWRYLEAEIRRSW